MPVQWFKVVWKLYFSFDPTLNLKPLQKIKSIYTWAPQVALVVKNPPANAGAIRDVGLISELGRAPEGGHGNPLQYSCLENSMDRGVWMATVHDVTESDWSDLARMQEGDKEIQPYSLN